MLLSEPIHYLATILSPDGAIREDALPDGDNDRVLRLYDLVGGHLEIVPIKGARYLVMNEGAKDKHLQANKAATDLAHEAESIPDGDYIAGTVVVVAQAALR
jgi:hypothetical protein